MPAAAGWPSIPRGCGEVEYELGASLRNLAERRELVGSITEVERRLGIYAAHLGVDTARAFRWAFAQGVRSALWSTENGAGVNEHHTGLALARAVEPLLG